MFNELVEEQTHILEELLQCADEIGGKRFVIAEEHRHDSRPLSWSWWTIHQLHAATIMNNRVTKSHHIRRISGEYIEPSSI
jgi:hypothetical protein